jgi:hypothetical protein
MVMNFTYLYETILKDHCNSLKCGGEGAERERGGGQCN